MTQTEQYRKMAGFINWKDEPEKPKSISKISFKNRIRRLYRKVINDIKQVYQNFVHRIGMKTGNIKITYRILEELGFENGRNKDFWFHLNVEDKPRNWSFTLVSARFFFEEGVYFYFYPNSRYKDFDFKTNRPIIQPDIDYTIRIKIETLKHLRQVFKEYTRVSPQAYTL